MKVNIKGCCIKRYKLLRPSLHFSRAKVISFSFQTIQKSKEIYEGKIFADFRDRSAINGGEISEDPSSSPLQSMEYAQ